MHNQTVKYPSLHRLAERIKGNGRAFDARGFGSGTQDYSRFHILNDHSITEKTRSGEFYRPPRLCDRAPSESNVPATVGLPSAVARRWSHLGRLFPGEVDQWWRERSKMRVVGEGNGWPIERKGKERARLAFASLVGDKLAFTVDEHK